MTPHPCAQDAVPRSVLRVRSYAFPSGAADGS
jgi:hypothetical protein